jgi:hypothetical protein
MRMSGCVVVKLELNSVITIMLLLNDGQPHGGR